MTTSTSKRREGEKDLEFMPVFCTAELTTEVLDTFIKSAIDGRNEAENYRPVILTTTDISTIVSPTASAPPSGSLNPFLGWTVDECYQFFLLNISTVRNEVAGAWTAHTFVVLDTQTTMDQKTCFLCSDVEDYLERHRIVLKCVRSNFDQALLEGMCYETFVRRPSESGAGVLATGETLVGNESFMGLSIMPPLAFGSIERRRAIVSYGMVNETIKEGRRFWDRYVEENEREDRERKANGQESLLSGPSGK